MYLLGYCIPGICWYCYCRNRSEARCYLPRSLIKEGMLYFLAGCRPTEKLPPATTVTHCSYHSHDSHDMYTNLPATGLTSANTGRSRWNYRDCLIAIIVMLEARCNPLHAICDIGSNLAPLIYSFLMGFCERQATRAARCH